MQDETALLRAGEGRIGIPDCEVAAGQCLEEGDNESTGVV
jgi:hypothetical protein